MSKRIEYRSENGKWGFNALPMSIEDNELKSAKTKVTLKISHDNFFAGIKQYALSKEQALRRVGEKDNLRLVDLELVNVDPALYSIIGIIENRESKLSERVNFINIAEFKQNMIEIELIKWYAVTKDNRSFPLFEEFLIFLAYGVADRWRESHRQLMEFFEYPPNRCETRVFDRTISATPDMLIWDGKNEIENIVKSYYYYLGEENTPIHTKISYSFLNPDYHESSYEIIFIANDDEPLGEKIYSDVMIRGLVNIIADVKIKEIHKSKCQVEIFKNENLPYHEKFLSLIQDWLQNNFEEATSDSPKFRRGGKRPETIEKESVIKKILKEYPDVYQYEIAEIATERLGRNVSRQAVSRVANDMKKENK